MTQHLKKIIGAGLLSLAISLPFATDAQAYYGHRYGGVIVAGPYYPYSYPVYAPPYAYAPPPYPYTPPPYAYAPPPYPYAPPVVAAPIVAPALGVGIHIR